MTNNSPAISIPATTNFPAAATVDPATQAKAEQIVETLREANQLLTNGNNDAALAKVNIALAGDPKSVAAYIMRGAVYTNKKMWAKAQSDFETAHLLDPKNELVEFNLAEVKFVQKMYDLARPGFAELQNDKTSDIGDLAAYKVFLCDLFGGHPEVAAKELEAFDLVGSNASYYYAHAAWDLFHHKTDDARGWLISASHIYSPNKNGFYSLSLFQLGYLPLPSVP